MEDQLIFWAKTLTYDINGEDTQYTVRLYILTSSEIPTFVRSNYIIVADGGRSRKYEPVKIPIEDSLHKRH